MTPGTASFQKMFQTKFLTFESKKFILLGNFVKVLKNSLVEI